MKYGVMVMRIMLVTVLSIGTWAAGCGAKTPSAIKRRPADPMRLLICDLHSFDPRAAPTTYGAYLAAKLRYEFMNRMERQIEDAYGQPRSLHALGLEVKRTPNRPSSHSDAIALMEREHSKLALWGVLDCGYNDPTCSPVATTRDERARHGAGDPEDCACKLEIRLTGMGPYAALWTATQSQYPLATDRLKLEFSESKQVFGHMRLAVAIDLLLRGEFGLGRALLQEPAYATQPAHEDRILSQALGNALNQPERYTAMGLALGAWLLATQWSGSTNPKLSLADRMPWWTRRGWTSLSSSIDVLTDDGQTVVRKSSREEPRCDLVLESVDTLEWAKHSNAGETVATGATPFEAVVNGLAELATRRRLHIKTPLKSNQLPTKSRASVEPVRFANVLVQSAYTTGTGRILVRIRKLDEEQSGVEHVSFEQFASEPCRNPPFYLENLNVAVDYWFTRELVEWEYISYGLAKQVRVNRFRQDSLLFAPRQVTEDGRAAHVVLVVGGTESKQP